VTAPREPSDTTLPPDPGLFTLPVTPTPAELSTTEPGRTLYLGVTAWEQYGRALKTFVNGTPDGS